MNVKKIINWWAGSGGSASVSVTITTDVPEPAEGIFPITITFSQTVTGFTLGDIDVVNGSVEDLTSEDNIVFTANVIPDSLGDVEISIAAGSVTPSNSASNTLEVEMNEQWLFLTNPANTHIYYEFRELVGDNTAAILTTDPGILDLSRNNRTLSLINSPSMANLVLVADVAEQIMTLRNTTNACVSIGGTGSTFLNANFSVWFAFRSADGRPASSYWACGNNDATNTGLALEFLGADAGAGQASKLRVRYQGFVWTSTNQLLADNATGLHAFEIHFDFTNDTLTVILDGASVAGSFTTGNISSTDPTAYNCSANFFIGTRNNNGTAFSNPQNNQIAYFSITDLVASPAALRTYLDARPATFQQVDVISMGEFPHDLIFSEYHEGRFYVSGKGSDTLTNVDGSFDIGEIDANGQLTSLGTYSNQGDQLDGETVLELSADRVLHFVDDAALLFNVSNPAAPAKIRTVANGNGVVNGAIQIGNYVFGANKGGFIDVFDVTTIDTFTLVGSYDTSTDLGGDGPHDIDVTADGEHVIIVSRPGSSYDFAIYKVFNAGVLIPIASWSVLSRIDNASLADANRTREMFGTTALVCGNPNFATVDISNLSAPIIADTFAMTTFSSGVTRYKNRWAIPTWQVGVRLLNVTDPTDIIQDAGCYFTDFTEGNASWHDLKVIRMSGVNYLVVTAQSSSQIVSIKINRH